MTNFLQLYISRIMNHYALYLSVSAKPHPKRHIWHGHNKRINYINNPVSILVSIWNSECPHFRASFVQ